MEWYHNIYAHEFLDNSTVCLCLLQLLN